MFFYSMEQYNIEYTILKNIDNGFIKQTRLLITKKEGMI